MTSVISEVFGRMLSASQIEDTVIASLRMWFPTYLREIERQMDMPPSTLKAPENYSDRNSFDAEAGEELPKVVVIAPGTVGSPSKKGNNTYTATWRLGVGVATGAETEADSNRMTKAYGAAVRGIMLQNSGLDTIGAVDIYWTDEAYDDLPVPNLVQLVKAASLYFNVDVNNVISRGQGPLIPNADPYDYGEAETVEVELEQIPIN